MRTETVAARAPTRVLVIGDDPRETTTMIEMLRDAWPGGLLVTQAGEIADALHELSDHSGSCVLLALADEDLAPLRTLVAAAPDAAVVVVSPQSTEELGVSAVAAGAQDHLVAGDLHPTLLTRAVRFALERKRSEVRLTQQALEDPLTGLPNRVLFLDRLSGALDRSRRTGNAPAVMFLDVDSFKSINDSLGHSAGDHLLGQLAERFSALLRPMDTVARLGGDEFTFLFEGLSGREEAVAIARRVIAAAAEPIVLGGSGDGVSVAVSIGVEMLDDPQIALTDALNGADAAMYRAKSLGGGRAELHESETPSRSVGRVPSPAVPDPSNSESALREALDRGELRVHYQPRVSIDGRTGLVGFEALMRWAHPQRGLLSPDEFLGLVTSEGLAAELGDWVTGEALGQVRRWRQTRPGMTISVNLSERELRDPGLPERIEAQLHEHRVEPGVLCLEVAQATVLGDLETAGAALRDLAELGVGLAVDAVGREPATNAVLRELPMTMLKIDRSVVADLDADGEPGKLVHHMVALGHELGASVVGQGVETDRQLAHLRELGCDGAQGFLFSRAVPEQSVSELLGAG